VDAGGGTRLDLRRRRPSTLSSRAGLALSSPWSPCSPPASPATGVCADPASHPVLIESLPDDTAAQFRAHPLRAAARAVAMAFRRRNLDEDSIHGRADLGPMVEAVRSGR
jgi:hypothetical protein